VGVFLFAALASVTRGVRMIIRLRDLVLTSLLLWLLEP
jgi:hypothetical protein